MADNDYELAHAFERKTSPPPVIFEDVWPSETRGKGLIRKNNILNGGRQGKGSFIQKASCRQCGFMVDLARNDHSGGSIDGNGAQFVASTATATATLSNGTTHTENYGTPGTRNGAGCPLCGSKNSSKMRLNTPAPNPWSRITPLGF